MYVALNIKMNAFVQARMNGRICLALGKKHFFVFKKFKIMITEPNQVQPNVSSVATFAAPE